MWNAWASVARPIRAESTMVKALRLGNEAGRGSRQRDSKPPHLVQQVPASQSNRLVRGFHFR